MQGQYLTLNSYLIPSDLCCIIALLALLQDMRHTPPPIRVQHQCIATRGRHFPGYTTLLGPESLFVICLAGHKGSNGNIAQQLAVRYKGLCLKLLPIMHQPIYSVLAVDKY